MLARLDPLANVRAGRGGQPRFLAAKFARRNHVAQAIFEFRREIQNGRWVVNVFVIEPDHLEVAPLEQCSQLDFAIQGRARIAAGLHRGEQAVKFYRVCLALMI